MAQPRPTHEVFRQDPPTPSYDKFIRAQSAHGSRDDDDDNRPVDGSNVPNIDRLEQLRKDDEAYLEHVAQSQRNNAHQELQREQREVEQFRRERASVKRRVNVAQGVRGRIEQPLIGSLGLGSIVKKRRVEKRGYMRGKSGDDSNKNVGNDSEDKICQDFDTEKQLSNGVTKEDTGVVRLVSGYSSSSEEEGNNTRGDERSEAADERTNSEKDDG